ncbi:MAG TPA: FecR domain-containing protein [Reyranella sp.]|nr:FecR domain-containing protein [Reyranella sp.]
MAKRIVATDFSLIRALLLGTTALVLIASPASAKIGVTSATDGDPLGKPPTETERVLRIGIDVQADELITTKNNDRAHLVFLDGTSITVGPNAVVKLDKFVYDPNTKKGEMALTASKGVLRLVGGKISKSNAITIATPSSTIGIRGGITILSVSSTRTVSTFVFGNSLTVSGAGATQTITRPGSQVVTNFGGTPGNPTPVPPGGLNGSLGALEGNPNQGSTPGGSNPDQQAQNSGFSSQNSGQPPTTPPPVTTTTTNTTTNTTSNAVNNSNSSTNPNPVTTTTTATTVTDTTTTTTLTSYGRLVQLSPSGSLNNSQKLTSPGSTAHTDETTTVTQTTTTTVDGKVTNTTTTPISSKTVVGPTYATISAPGGGLSGSGTSNSGGGESGSTLTVPWLPGQIFQFTAETSLGPANGLGLVAATEDFFAYTFVVASGANAGQKFLMFGGTPTAKSNFPTVGIGAQTLTNLGNPGALPFAPDTVGSDAALQANAASSPLYSVYTPNLNGTNGSQSVPNALQVTISIAGSSVTQKSYMGVFIGNYGTDSATQTVYSAGTFMDSYRLGPNQHIGRGVSSQATADTGAGSAIYGSTGQYQVYTPDKVVTSDGTTTRTPGAALDQSAANQLPTSYYPVTMATPVADASTLPQDLGQTRTTQTMNGYVGGLVEQRTGNTFKTVVPTLSIFTQPTDVSISTNRETNQALGTIVMRGLDGTLFSPTATLQLGGTSGANGPVSAFIDDKRYVMITQTNDPNRQSTLQPILGRPSTLNNNTMLASYQTAPVALPGGVQPCTCDYLSWGFWSSNMSAGSNTTYNVNLGTYVVGQLTDRLQMPQTGFATYNGTMVGNVQNGSNAYVAAGNYQSVWSFGARAGSFNGSFDGTNYAGAAVANLGSGGVTFTGAFAGGGRAGVLAGSFYGPQAQNQGGSFNIGNNLTAYKASGIFFGQR